MQQVTKWYPLQILRIKALMRWQMLMHSERVLLIQERLLRAEEFYITGHSALTPERNTVIKAADGENQVAFALSPEERVFAANYEGDMLTEVKSAYAGDGVEIIKIKNVDKIFVWDENCRPLN